MALKSEKIFEQIEAAFKEKGPELVKKQNAIYRFEISEKKGSPVTTWTIDLKNGNGSISKSAEGKADVTFTLLDNDFLGLVNKTLNPQQAFMTGKMKIKGNMALATKFTPDLLGGAPLPKL